MTHAIRLTEENIDDVIADAKDLGFDLDHLRDEMTYNRTEYVSDTILIRGGEAELGNLTYSTMTDTDFFSHWTWTDHLPFRKIIPRV